MKKIISLSAILASAIALTACTCANSAKQEPYCNNLKGKLFCGYQGWYRVPTDGSGLGWEHWETPAEDFEPGKCGIDAWPDMSELDPDEKVATKFKHADGSTAFVYTNENKKTVNRHFKWMKEYGIDGVFLQRFALDVTGGHHQSNLLLPSNNRVFKNALDGAENNGRAIAIMYDLTLMGKDNDKNSLQKVKNDWKKLLDEYKFFDSPAYMRHNGKPVVAIYGIGFGDNRAYTMEEQADLINFFKTDKKYGGCAIVLGTPTYWRTLDKDTINDKRLHDMIKSADVLLPWSVGRFGGIEGAKHHAKNQFAPDAKWCKENGVLYMPLAFPGFSWANRYPGRKFDQIPRLGGKFFWQQIVEAKRAGADLMYVAMFDEMDEATQIFKVTNNPPAGSSSRFLTYQPEDSDLYLRLCGKAAQLFRGEIEPTDELPIKPKASK